MKKLALLFGLLLSSYSYSQELMNFYIEPSGLNEVNLHTLVYNNTFSSFGSSSLTINENTITLILCYLNTSGQSPIYDFQENTINLPNGYSTYAINIEIYGDNDALQPCSLENLVDTGTITFSYPYNPTANTYIPDNVFENYLENLGFGDDIANNDLVFTHRIINNTHLFLDENFIPLSGDILSMEGVQDFVNLKDLHCSDNQIASLDTSNNFKLRRLSSLGNPLTSLNISNNLELKYLSISSNVLTNVDVTNNSLLEWLDIRNSLITNMDISQNINLLHLDIGSNTLDTIDISSNILINYFVCSYNQLSFVDVSNNNNLETVYCNNNQLISFNTNNSPSLKSIYLSNNQINTLNFSSNSLLERVVIFSNNLTSLNLKNGNNANILYLSAGNNDNLYCIDVDDEEAANNGEFPYSDWNVEDQVVFSEDCSLGLNDIITSQITLYPNPIQDMLYINSDVAIYSIQVFNVLGRLVLEENTPIGQIDVSSFKSGVFFIKITTGQGSITKKMVKE